MFKFKFLLLLYLALSIVLHKNPSAPQKNYFIYRKNKLEFYSIFDLIYDIPLILQNFWNPFTLIITCIIYFFIFLWFIYSICIIFIFCIYLPKLHLNNSFFYSLFIGFQIEYYTVLRKNFKNMKKKFSWVSLNYWIISRFLGISFRLFENAFYIRQIIKKEFKFTNIYYSFFKIKKEIIINFSFYHTYIIELHYTSRTHVYYQNFKDMQFFYGKNSIIILTHPLDLNSAFSLLQMKLSFDIQNADIKIKLFNKFFNFKLIPKWILHFISKIEISIKHDLYNQKICAERIFIENPEKENQYIGDISMVGNYTFFYKKEIPEKLLLSFNLKNSFFDKHEIIRDENPKYRSQNSYNIGNVLIRHTDYGIILESQISDILILIECWALFHPLPTFETHAFLNLNKERFDINGIDKLDLLDYIANNYNNSEIKIEIHFTEKTKHFVFQSKIFIV